MSVPKVVIPIQLDRPRKMVLDLNAWCAVEEALGVSFLGGGAAAIDFASFRSLRAFMWAALRREDPTLTLEAVGDLIDAAGIETVSNKLAEAINAALPAPDAEGNALGSQ